MKEILSKLRNSSFKIIDSINGSNISKAYKEIQDIDLSCSNDQDIINFKNTALKKLISHTLTTTDFYNNMPVTSDISDFPVITKNVIKADQEKFMSRKYKKNKLYQMSTSGSTGSPFISYQNVEKKTRVTAEVIYYSNKVGYSVGNKLFYLRGLTPKTKKNRLKLWFQNESLIDVNNLGYKNIENIVSEFKKAPNNSIILSYASTLDLISKYCQKYNIKHIADFSGIISSSEMLYDETRESISKLFNCKVFSRYSNQENGIIGQDENINNNFIINEASYFVEIFDLNKDEPVEDGKTGRVVITDLFNYAMPMIRYDTGDIGSKELIKVQGRTKYVINNFGGRTGDLVTDTYGNLLSSVGIGNNMSKFQNIKQYQFIQKDKDKYEVKLVLNDNQDIEEEIKSMLYNILGRKAYITVKYVKEIPKLSSGKRKYIINESNIVWNK